MSASHSRWLLAAGIAVVVGLSACGTSNRVTAAASNKPDKDRKAAPEFELKDADAAIARD